MTKYDFHYAMLLANLLYDVTFLDESIFEEIALVAYGKIGNKDVKLNRIIAKPDPIDLSITLPCDCEEIEAVTHWYEDWSDVDGTHHHGDISTSFTEQYIEARKYDLAALYQRGKFIPYERVKDKIYFRHPHGSIMILYKAKVLDENGLPYLTEAEANAIAAFVAHVLKMKQALKTNNQALMQFALQLERKWLTYVDLARSPEYVNQNDMQEIINIKNSWDRGLYGSYKPVKK